jgi:F-type H+-transporting ATPase subunit epsilon
MHLSLTTPKGGVVDTEIEELVAPGAGGELGVLPGHIPLMAGLRPGVLVYRKKEGAPAHVLAVGEGFLQVSQTPAGADRILVLVHQAMPAASVDKAVAAKDLAEAEKALAAWQGELGVEYQTLSLRRGWAQARLDAAERSAPH